MQSEAQEIVQEGHTFRLDTREEQLAHIYAEVAGGRALDRVLREDASLGIPPKHIFWRWHMEDEEIRDNLARARLNGVEAHLEEALEIADTPQEGEEVTVDEEGNVKTKRFDMLGHRKLQIETRIKRAQMIAPRKYGPKMDLTTDGQPISHDPGDVAAKAAALLATARERKGK